jgi:hypothetical protein
LCFLKELHRPIQVRIPFDTPARKYISCSTKSMRPHAQVSIVKLEKAYVENVLRAKKECANVRKGVVSKAYLYESSLQRMKSMRLAAMRLAESERETKKRKKRTIKGKGGKGSVFQCLIIWTMH